MPPFPIRRRVRGFGGHPDRSNRMTNSGHSALGLPSAGSGALSRGAASRGAGRLPVHRSNWGVAGPPDSPSGRRSSAPRGRSRAPPAAAARFLPGVRSSRASALASWPARCGRPSIAPPTIVSCARPPGTLQAGKAAGAGILRKDQILVGSLVPSYVIENVERNKQHWETLQRGEKAPCEGALRSFLKTKYF